MSGAGDNDRFVRRADYHVTHAHSLLTDARPAFRSACGLSRADRCGPGLYARLVAAGPRPCRRCVKSTGGAEWAPFDWIDAWEQGYCSPTSSPKSWLANLPWPDGLATLVTNNGSSREVHAFDLSDELELSWCRRVNTNEIEAREVVGPEPTMCRRCLRLRAEAAGIDPGPMTMTDVAQDRHANSMERIASIGRRARAL